MKDNPPAKDQVNFREMVGSFVDDHMDRSNRVIVVLSVSCDGSGNTAYSLLTTGSVSDIRTIHGQLAHALDCAVQDAVLQSSAVGEA